MLPSELNLELTSDPRELSLVRSTLRAWLPGQGWSDWAIEELVLAVDEALTNVMRHGYLGQTGQPIRVELRGLAASDAGPGIEVRVRDFGRQVDPATICGRDLAQVRPGGLGVHIIRNIMDSACWSAAEGGGMLLVMTRYQTRPAR